MDQREVYSAAIRRLGAVARHMEDPDHSFGPAPPVIGAEPAAGLLSKLAGWFGRAGGDDSSSEDTNQSGDTSTVHGTVMQ